MIKPHNIILSTMFNNVSCADIIIIFDKTPTDISSGGWKLFQNEFLMNYSAPRTVGVAVFDVTQMYTRAI